MSTGGKVGFAAVFTDITRRGTLQEEASIHTVEMTAVCMSVGWLSVSNTCSAQFDLVLPTAVLSTFHGCLMYYSILVLFSHSLCHSEFLAPLMVWWYSI